MNVSIMRLPASPRPAQTFEFRYKLRTEQGRSIIDPSPYDETPLEGLYSFEYRTEETEWTPGAVNGAVWFTTRAARNRAVQSLQAEMEVRAPWIN